MKPRRPPAALLLSLAVLLGACTSTNGGSRPTSQSQPPPSNPLADQDKWIRPVRMTSGPALTYVQPETASQILCQIMDKDLWGRLLGGRVGRHPGRSSEPECQIATGESSLSLRLYGLDSAFTPETTTAGRPATFRNENDGDVVVTMALTDEALRRAPHLYRRARPLLELRVISTLPVDVQRERAARILAELVPLLLKAGDPLPPIDDDGDVRYVRTPLTGGGQIVDLPQPVQGLQLCTLMQEEPDIRVVPTTLELDGGGQCRLLTKRGGVMVALQHGQEKIDSYPDRVAGRPARKLDSGYCSVRLRDDVPVELVVTAPDDASNLAEKLVPLLLRG